MAQQNHRTSVKPPGEELSGSQPPIEVRRADLKQLGAPQSSSSERERFGRIVAVRRAELGLSQEDLAVRMGTSRSGVARIEAGQTPSPEALHRLLVALNGEPAAPPPRPSFVRAPATRRAQRPWKRTPTTPTSLTQTPLTQTPLTETPRTETPGKPLDRRWLWGALAIAVLVPLLVVVGARAFSGGGGETSPQSLEAVTAVPSVLAAVEQVQEQAQQAEETRAAKEAAQAAKARKAAERREAAAARKEEAAAAPVSSDEGSTDTVSEPVIAPVTSSPPAPSGGGSGGGGSSGPPPQLQHGVGGGGG